jgi:Carboxypeptidase regulatory-like domain/TonB-dependent Receptor Plug Domain
MRNPAKIAGLLVLLLALGGLAAAQTTGSVQGAVTDPQKAIVANATVELTQTTTGTSKTLQTNSAGRFVFDFVQAGTYVVKVSSDGFRTATVDKVLVEAGKGVSINVALQLGAIGEVIEIQAGGQPVNVIDAQVSTNVGEHFIKELPSYNRNVLTYAAMQPGVDMDTNQGSQILNIGGTGASVNGNRDQRNNFYMDGMDNRNYRNAAMQMPNPDAVQEVQVSTSNTSAEYGRQVGGVFNVVTKSGSNAFHGSGFYFTRDKAMNARPYGTSPTSEKPDQNQRTMGATLGGPILKNRTFFFASYDHYKDKSAYVRDISDVPTAAMINGDFSAFTGTKTIYNPATGLAFADNKIPSNMIDTVGKSIANLLPTVGAYGDHYIWTYLKPAKNQTFLARIDHHWGSKHTTTFTWMRSNGSATYPGNDGDYIKIPAWGPQVNESSQNLYHGRHTWAIKNNLLADFRVGYTRHNADRDNTGFTNAFPGSSVDLMTALGAQNTTVIQQGARQYLPSIGIGNDYNAWGAGLFGGEGWLGVFDQPSFHFGGTVSWAATKHTLKIGADMIRVGHRYGVSGGAPAQTTMSFDGSATSPDKKGGDFVYGMADLLLGRTTGSGFFQGGNLDYWTHRWENYFFIQDEWKLTPRLTLSPGVRYEFYLPPTLTNGQQNGYFVTDTANPATSTFQSTLFPNAPRGIAFVGDPGVPTGFYKRESNLIAPRLGIAWDVNGDGRLAVRGGIGKYYGSTPLQTLDWLSEQNPWQPSASCPGPTIASNPWLACKAATFTAPPTPFTFSSVQAYKWPNPVPFFYGFDANYKTAYSYQWNVSVEREMSKALTLQLGYIGNRGRNLSAGKSINYARYAPDANADNTQARRPNQGFKTLNMMTSSGKSSYNALQAVANVRLGSSLSSRVFYVYQRGYANCDADPVNTEGSNCFANPINPEGEWAQNTRHHAFKFFFTWELPFLRNSGSLAGKVLGGWQISGNGSFNSGAPANVTLSSGDWNYDSVGGDRPDLVGTIEYPKTDNTDGSFQWLSASAFATPGGGTNHNVFGNLKRNAVFGPGWWSVDTAIMKSFRFTKSQGPRAQIRFEAYNVFNHPNLNGPNYSLGDGNFGKIWGKNGSRAIQLGLKLYF